MTPYFPNDYLLLSAALFAIGAAGVLLRRNLIMVLISVELMLNAANLALAVGARLHGDVHGQVLILLVMTAAAAEVAIGLAIAIKLYRAKQTLDINALEELKH